MFDKGHSPDHATMTSHVIRLLILSYFAALGIGAVEGAQLSRLTRPFLDDPHASYSIGLVVLILAFMVLIGMFRRPAALILSLVLFWASYLTMLASGDLGGFWRDLALIGGLCMLAGVGDPIMSLRRAKGEDEVDLIEPLETIAPRQTGVSRSPRTSISRFREDLEIAREA